MTVDLFAASFICREAELGSVLQLGAGRSVPDQDAPVGGPTERLTRLAGRILALAVPRRRSRTASPA